MIVEPKGFRSGAVVTSVAGSAARTIVQRARAARNTFYALSEARP
jgi:hypothetical protein